MDRSSSGGYGARPPRWQQQQQPVHQQARGEQQHPGSAVVAAAPAAEALGVPLSNNGIHGNRLADGTLHLDNNRGLGDPSHYCKSCAACYSSSVTRTTFFDIESSPIVCVLSRTGYLA